MLPPLVRKPTGDYHGHSAAVTESHSYQTPQLVAHASAAAGAAFIPFATVALEA